MKGGLSETSCDLLDSPYVDVFKIVSAFRQLFSKLDGMQETRPN
jgi:hypothetical protein